MFTRIFKWVAATALAASIATTLTACLSTTEADGGSPCEKDCTDPDNNHDPENSSSSISSEKESPTSSCSSLEKPDTDCEGEPGKPWSGATAKKFACGSGSEGNPFVIKTAEQLANLSFVIGAGDEKYVGKHFKLGADIILNKGEIIDGDGMPVDSTAELFKWTPIGKSDNAPFTGHFDGDGHTISGLFVNTNGRFNGLFGYCSCTIKNLNIENSWVRGAESSGAVVGAIEGGSVLKNITVKANVHSTYENAGGIVGLASGGTVPAKIEGVESYGKIYSQYFSGGILGLGSFTEIKDAKNYANVGGLRSLGGIVGGLHTSALTSKTENLGNVSGQQNVGGIVGFHVETGTVENSKNSGKVSGNYAVGGIIGDSRSMTIRRVANTVEISGGSRTGGIAGTAENLKMEDVYNTGDIACTEYAGGIIGLNRDGVTRNAYTTGRLTSSPSKFKNVGVMIGANENTTLADYYYIEQEVSDTTWSNPLDVTVLVDTVSTTPCEITGILDTVAFCPEYHTQPVEPVMNITTWKIPAFGASDGGVALAKTSEEMRTKNFAELLGDEFVYDSKKNDGYPVLKWE